MSRRVDVICYYEHLFRTVEWVEVRDAETGEKLEVRGQAYLWEDDPPEEVEATLARNIELNP